MKDKVIKYLNEFLDNPTAKNYALLKFYLRKYYENLNNNK